jgi:uncharacterized protein
MKTPTLPILGCVLLLAAPAMAQEAARPSSQAVATSAGIPLDSPWRVAVYEQARAHFEHPGWGWRHSERDYLLATRIAEAEGLTVDPDVLFAAAMLHDWGGIEPFRQEGVQHEPRSVELAEPFLREAGFPMEKFPAVRAAILGHSFWLEPDASPEAIVLHDADALDFLGALGAARLLASTGDAADYDRALDQIERFARDIPGRLKTATAREMAGPRVEAMTAFLAELRREVPEGARP